MTASQPSDIFLKTGTTVLGNVWFVECAHFTRMSQGLINIFQGDEPR